MARIVASGGGFNAVYSIKLSNEERELLRTSKEGIKLLQECNSRIGELRHSALSELSEDINKELQRLRSLANMETREANLADAEVKRTQGLEAHQRQSRR